MSRTVEHEISKDGHKVYFKLNPEQMDYLSYKAEELLEGSIEEASITYRVIMEEEPTNIRLKAFYELLRTLTGERAPDFMMIEGGKEDN